MICLEGALFNLAPLFPGSGQKNVMKTTTGRPTFITRGARGPVSVSVIGPEEAGRFLKRNYVSFLRSGWTNFPVRRGFIELQRQVEITFGL